MKRTTVFLPEPLHERLRQEAFSCHMSMAALIRSRLERTNGRRKRQTASADPLADVEGIVRDGTLSRDIDDALYGR